jgi:nucleotide-binding universal stress UspA family protein
MRNILVPLDGSPFGEHALPKAIALAASSGAVLHVVHVHDSPTLPFTLEGYSLFDSGWTERSRAASRGYLEGIAANHAMPAGVTTCVRLLEAPVVESLVEYAEGHDIDLIVMTTHGRGGLSRAWLGSVADELIREVGVPVLLLRPTREPAGTGAAVEAPIAEVLLPLDGSPLAAAALTPAVDMALLTGARLTLLHVVPPMFMAGPPYSPVAASFDADAYRLERARAERYLTDMAAKVPASVGEVRSLLVTHAQPAIAIGETATELGVDLIVLATHGRGGVARWALGSVADKLVRSGTSAVLVIRPGVPSRLGNPTRHEHMTVA